MRHVKSIGALTLVLLLGGCAPAAPPAEGDGGAPNSVGGDGAVEGAGGATGACAGDLDEDLVPFSSDLVTEPIPDHAVYGDGSEIAFTTSLGAGLFPSFELLKFVDGIPTSYTAGNWEDAGDGRYTTALSVFDSDLDGQEGLVKVTAFPEGVTFDGERYEGDQVVLGIYCITYAVE